MDLFFGAIMIVGFAGMIASWIIMAFFYREHLARLDEIVLGHRHVVDLYEWRAHRALDYSFACTFDVIARRAHPNVDFKSVPADLKRPFKAMAVLLMLSLGGLIVGGVWAGFFR